MLKIDFHPRAQGQERWWVLTIEGPWLELDVGVHPGEAQQRVMEGDSVPSAQRVRGLIDTGASLSVVDPSICGALGIRPHNVMPVLGVGDEDARVWPISMVSISFPGSELVPWNVSVAVAPIRGKTGAELVLLGRDFLAGRTFQYDGVEGSIRVSERRRVSP